MAILEEDPTLGIASPTVAWADAALQDHARVSRLELSVRDPPADPDTSPPATIPSPRAPAIEEFSYHLRAGSHLVIAGAKHEILQEQDRFRAQFWAAFDVFVPGTPLFG